MQSKDKKNLNIKVVLLKQMPQNRSYYNSAEIKDELGKKVSFSQKNKATPKNPSIAYLSSIIQDDKFVDQDNYLSFAQNNQTSDKQSTLDKKYSVNIEQHNKMFRLLRNRQNGRQLSSLIQNSEDKNKIYRSKTQGIDKIIEQRKLMPINRLKIKPKNITFTSKNKQDLSKDFNQFIINKELMAQNLKENSQRSNILYQKRRLQHEKQKKSSLWLTSIQRQIKNNVTKSVQKKSPIKSVSPSKLKQEQQHRYASYLKRLKSSIPQIQHFGWSKLNKELFKLQSAK